MATKAAQKRLTKEYKSLQESSPPYITARPSESNILEWHYIIDGPVGTPYEDGQYHGTIIFPAQYPFKPPAIRMITPNGRFQTNTKLCLSMSDFHPETWNPAWNVATILNGLLSFMTSEDQTSGSIKTTIEQKITFSKNSVAWNIDNPKFKLIFPDILEDNKLVLANKKTRKSQIRSIEGKKQNNEDKLTKVDNKTEDTIENKAINKEKKGKQDIKAEKVEKAENLDPVTSLLKTAVPDKSAVHHIIDLDTPIKNKKKPEIIDLDDEPKRKKDTPEKGKHEVINLDVEVIEL